MHIENIHSAKAHLSRLIKRALAGEEVLIAHAGQPLVRLTPLSQELVPRLGGQWKGQIRVAEGFDHFGVDLEQLFYGGDE